MNEDFVLEDYKLSSDKNISIEYKEKMKQALLRAIDNLDNKRMCFIIVTRVNDSMIAECFGNMDIPESLQAYTIFLETTLTSVEKLKSEVGKYGKRS